MPSVVVELGRLPGVCSCRSHPIEENDMRRYEQVSGAFFCLVAGVQLTRLVLRWPVQVADVAVPLRSEEHTSELQSQSNLVCRLLLEKKKKKNKSKDTI